MIIYCSDCIDPETPVVATYIAYGKSLCSHCFFRHQQMDRDMRRATGDPDLVPDKQESDNGD